MKLVGTDKENARKFALGLGILITLFVLYSLSKSTEDCIVVVSRGGFREWCEEDYYKGIAVQFFWTIAGIFAIATAIIRRR